MQRWLSHASECALGERRIYHQREDRIEAHIFIAFLAYCLHVTLGHRLKHLAPGLTTRSVLEKFSAVQMIDVRIPISDGRELALTRYTQPEPDQKLLIERLKLTLPAQPPPLPPCSADLRGRPPRNQRLTLALPANPRSRAGGTFTESDLVQVAEQRGNHGHRRVRLCVTGPSLTRGWRRKGTLVKPHQAELVCPARLLGIT